MAPITAERKPFTQEDADEMKAVLEEGARVRAKRAKAPLREMETLSSIDEIDADAIYAKWNGKAR